MNSVAPARIASDASTALTTALRYRRVSQKEQAEEGVSLDAQLDESRRYVARHAWALGDEYEDVETGRRDDRAAYQRLLIDVRGHRLAGRRLVLVVAALDRLGRNVAQRARVWEEMKRLGVLIHSVREGGVVSELTYNILASVAQEESRKNSERVTASNLYFIGRGWRAVGRPAWGYRLRPATPAERQAGAPTKVLEAHPDEAPYVREAWRQRANGESLKHLTRWIAGLPSAARGGRQMNFAAVRKLFRAPVYVARSGGPAGAGDDVLDRPPGHWEALVGDATWRRVRERDLLHRRMPGQASGRYELTGLVRCPKCGARMAGRSVRRARALKGGTKFYQIRTYACEGPMLAADARPICYATVSAKCFEPVVLDTVGELLDVLNQPLLADAVRRDFERREREAGQDDTALRIAGLERTLAQARARIADAVTLLLDGTLDRQAYDLARARYQADFEGAEAELARLRGRARPKALVSPAALLAGVAGWAGALRQGHPGAVRKALGVLVERLVPVKLGRGAYEAQITGRRSDKRCSRPPPGSVSPRIYTQSNTWARTSTPGTSPASAASSCASSRSGFSNGEGNE